MPYAFAASERAQRIITINNLFMNMNAGKHSHYIVGEDLIFFSSVLLSVAHELRIF